MSWPRSAKCAVCFSFDMDSELGWGNLLRRNDIFRDDPEATIMTSNIRQGLEHFCGLRTKV